MKTLNLKFSFLLLFFMLFNINCFAKGNATDLENPFSIVYSNNLYGDYVSIASSIQCVVPNATSTICNYNYVGNLYNAHSIYENSLSTLIIPLNSSTETLSLPSDIDGADILYAGLFWQGHIAGEQENTYNSVFSANGGIVGRDEVTMQDSSGTVHNITASRIWYQDFWGDGDDDDGGHRSFYQGYADITNILQNSYDKSIINNYTIGNIKSTIGNDFPTYFWIDNHNEFNGVRIGFWGNWNLIVVYNHSDITSLSPVPKPKNITIFHGFDTLIPFIASGTGSATKSIELSLSGFLTPSQLPISAKLLFYGSAGEKSLPFDTFKIQDKNTTNFLDLSNATNPVDNGFNGSVSSFGIPIDSNISYYPGLDSDEFDISNAMGTKQTSTRLSLSARFERTSAVAHGDQIIPGLIAFSTDIYEPNLCYDYSIKQDGSYLSIDRDNYQTARLDTQISSSDLEITVYLKTLEADIPAEGIAIRTDVNSSIFKHIGNISTSNTNGTILIDRGSPNHSTASLCAYDLNGDNSVGNSGCSDGYNIRKGNGTLNANEFVYTKFLLEPTSITGVEDINVSLGLSMKYYITAGGNKIEYPDYELGGTNIPLCPPNASYEPALGQFNVVQSGQQNNDIKNNIYTQISRNPFAASVVFDSTPLDYDNSAPTSDLNTTVLVEIIDVGSFGDINATCVNPDASLSAPIFVPLEFTPLNFQAPIATQGADYYNFAVKNASFRIWYFADSNGTLIQNWTATVDTNNTNVTSISGLYKSEHHPICSTECSPDTTKGCFECIKNNYSQQICARDNFSTRPESYNVKIYDINHTASDALKDSTKLDISNQDGFDPTSHKTSKRMNLAAGYNYRFDIDATGYDGINTVPGYTRNFNGGADYNATMIWDPQTTKSGCNDDSNVTLEFFVQNGAMINHENNHTNVGQYKINIIDQSWTAVDNTNRAHHIVTNSFYTDPDCQVGTTATTLSAGRYGCYINTDHNGSNNNYVRYYQDHDVEFLPYKFGMTGIIPSHGIDHNTTFDANTFIYMADMLYNSYSDQNMSFHLNGPISAHGKDDSTLSNFVDNCYAKEIDLTIQKFNIAASSYADHRFVFHNTDISTNKQNGSMKNLSDTITLNTDDFNKSNNGSVNTILNLNFDRNVSTVQNPETLTFTNYKVFCNNPANNCKMNAELNPLFETKGNMDLNQTGTNTNITINYLYARSHATRNRFSAPLDQNASIYYEVYCDGTIAGNTCDKDLLPNGIDSNTTDDPRWFVNENHTSNYGNAGNVNQKGYAVNNGFVTQDGAPTSAPTGNHQDKVVLDYNSAKGFPYKTTMQMESSKWLIYNKYNINATKNEFKVEYASDASLWGGKTETDSTTIEGGADSTNRRFMW
ncbi:MAG: hypothetical protein L3I99_02305 [Sulfurimonas sp.]|nr:hypothetical protein [Sulfurimonas sp.]